MLFPALQDSEGQDLDQVQLTGMLMSCVIGIFPSERNRKQPVTIDLCLYLHTNKAAKSTNIHDTVDYAAAVDEVSFILEQCEFLLIESAVEAVCQYFLKTYAAKHQLPQVDAVLVRISKPSALARGIVPAIQISRRRTAQTDDGAASQVVQSSEQGSLTLMQVPPGIKLLVTGRTGGEIKSALTLSKWWLGDGQPLKMRSAVLPLQNCHLTLSHSQPTSQLILLCH